MHGLLVVSFRQFAERRQTRRPHPDLQFLHVLQIRQIIRRVILRIPQDPIRWHSNVFRLIFRVTIDILIAVPSDPLIRHIVSPVLQIAVMDIQLH